MKKLIFSLIFLTGCFAPSQHFTQQEPAYILANPSFDTLTPYRNSETLIAVLDSGVDYQHDRIKPYLRNFSNSNEVIMGLDVLGNDYIPYYSIIDVDTLKDASAKLNAKEHGTHVSALATLGGRWRNINFSEKIALLPVRIFPLDSASVPSVYPQSVNNFFIKPAYNLAYAFIKALGQTFRFLENYPVKIINMSLGISLSNLPDDAETTLIDQYENEVASLLRASSALFVIAAGNDGVEVNSQSSHLANILKAPNTLIVGALNKDQTVTDFSNYGSLVDVYINGAHINSAVPGNTRASLSGTSMASPLISNLAAKLMAINPNLSATAVKEIILSTCDKRSYEHGEICIANFSKAMQKAATTR